jgi:hypothetical protein
MAPAVPALPARATAPAPEPTTASQERQYPLLADVQLETINSQADVESQKSSPGMF